MYPEENLENEISENEIPLEAVTGESEIEVEVPEVTEESEAMVPDVEIIKSFQKS